MVDDYGGSSGGCGGGNGSNDSGGIDGGSNDGGSIDGGATSEEESDDDDDMDMANHSARGTGNGAGGSSLGSITYEPGPSFNMENAHRLPDPGQRQVVVGCEQRASALGAPMSRMYQGERLANMLEAHARSAALRARIRGQRAAVTATGKRILEGLSM